MRNIMIVFLMMIGLTSVEAQISFEGTEMVTMTNGKNEIKKFNSRIVINSDTTEIDLFIGVAHIKEKILSLITIFKEETHDVLVYTKENNELLILHVRNGNIYSITFQSDMDNTLTFNL